MQDLHKLNTSNIGDNSIQSMFDLNVCKMRYRLSEEQAPWGVVYFGGVHLSGVDVYQDDGIGVRRAVRNYVDIAESPSDDFLLAMPFSARIDMAQSGRVVHCDPGSAILFSTNQPFSSSIAAMHAGGRYSQFLAKISGSKLRQRVPNIDAITNTTFDVKSGFGKILKSLFEHALEDGLTLPDEQTLLFSSMLIDATANIALALTGQSCLDSAERHTAKSRVQRKAIDFIESNLSNSRLSVALVAEHCGVSERYLRTIFSSTSSKIGNTIREMRLIQCRNALLSESMLARSITQIALNWGFDDPAHFSRAYNNRFGRSPSQERLQRKTRISNLSGI